MAVRYDIKCVMCGELAYLGSNPHAMAKKVEVVKDLTEYDYYSDNDPTRYRTSRSQWLDICHINLCDSCYAKLSNDMRVKMVIRDDYRANDEDMVNYSWLIAPTSERRERQEKEHLEAMQRANEARQNYLWNDNGISSSKKQTSWTPQQKQVVNKYKQINWASQRKPVTQKQRTNTKDSINSESLTAEILIPAILLVGILLYLIFS